jgi:cysteinyl-tRNA synthetase
MLNLVKTLEAKGFTYKTEDGIYFDSSKFPNYGALAGQSHIKGIKAGARVSFNESKRNNTDFALWKFSPKDKKRQMQWPSPWGSGFPGWHIECSAMAMKYLGQTIDIHCGGVDHIAIHHTNEIAQSEAATGKRYVNNWVHGEFLVMSAGKMSKSDGSFITLDVLKQKGYRPMDYRYLCLGAHYRTQLEFSRESLEFAKTTLKGLKERVKNIKAHSSPASGEFKSLESARQNFLNAMHDDLNAPKALSVLWEYIKSSATAGEKLEFVKYADNFLGLDLLKEEETKPLPQEAVDLIERRKAARAAKDFKTSDELRDELAKMGVEIKDLSYGMEWRWK